MSKRPIEVTKTHLVIDHAHGNAFRINGVVPTREAGRWVDVSQSDRLRLVDSAVAVVCQQTDPMDAAEVARLAKPMHTYRKRLIEKLNDNAGLRKMKQNGTAASGLREFAQGWIQLREQLTNTKEAGLGRATRSPSSPAAFSSDPDTRKQVEDAAMAAIMAAERTLGNAPSDVSDQKVGYDIKSYDPRIQRWRFIEVKGRTDGADTVTITRGEVTKSVREPEQFILAIVKVRKVQVSEPRYVQASEPRYIHGPLDDREPPRDYVAIQFDMNRLLERATEPS